MCVDIAFGAPTSEPTIAARAQVTAQNCGLGNYPDSTQNPARDGVDYLSGKDSDRLNVGGNTCTLVSCSCGTGILICNDSPGSYSICAREVASEAGSWYSTCDRSGAGGSGDATVPAMQAFYNDGHNVLVKGGFGC